MSMVAFSAACHVLGVDELAELLAVLKFGAKQAER